jgi:DNA-binding NarL/FixJ family response regulator
VVVDDEPLVRQGLALILGAEEDLEIVGEAADGAEALRVVRAARPHVVCMDVRMPGIDGLRATELLLHLPEPPKVLVVTTFEHDEHVHDALLAGASGFLLKRATAAEMVQAVRTLAHGTSRTVVHEGPPLTQREHEVLAHLARGLTNAEIAGELFLGVETVRTHVGNLLAKLGARDRTQAVVIAYRTGLVDPRRE